MTTQPLTPRRLTMQQAATAINTNIGGVIKLRSKGASLYDPAFPDMMTDGTFDAAEVLAWKVARDERATQQSTPAAPPPVATAAPLDRRATTTDRRTPNV